MLQCSCSCGLRVGGCFGDPGCSVQEGERIKLADARVFRPGDPDLPRTLRRSLGLEPDAPKAIDLFSGSGGLGLGLARSGFHVVLAVDSDPVACETYAHTLASVCVTADLTDPTTVLDAISEAGVDKVDLLAGGPPCQPFSRAARSKIRSLEASGRAPDERPFLWLAFLDFIRFLRPSLVLLENVPDLVLWESGETIRSICSSLETEGYVVHTRVLECWRYGVPQHRQRLFVVGTRPAYAFEWPKTLRVAPTIRDAISDLPRVGPGETSYWQDLGQTPSTTLQKQLRDEESSKVSDHVTREIREDDRQAFRLLKEGRTYSELPSKLRRYRSDIFDDKYNILGWDELSRSITAHIAKDGYWYIHPDGRRTLSIREAARLQTFPDWFRFAGYPSDRYRQIGNAVPPEVARHLGQSLRRALSSSHSPRTPREQLPFRAGDFRERLLQWHQKKARPYPWRQTRDPWLVLAAETLLRRTRADAVAKVWPEFERKFRTPAAVAKRPDAVRELLSPLGLRWRLENLLKIADTVVTKWGGRVPRERADLMSLPGVGDYVADAVQTFAHGNRAVLVDSNTARIASRVFGLQAKWTSLRNLSLRASVARLSGDWPPDAALNLALLDLGGTICLPGRPLCGSCPVRKLCITGLADTNDSSVVES